MDANLARIVHDLRTPLTALKMAADLLAARRGPAANPEELALLSSLQRNVARLERITEELQQIAEDPSLRAKDTRG